MGVYHGSQAADNSTRKETPERLRRTINSTAEGHGGMRGCCGAAQNFWAGVVAAQQTCRRRLGARPPKSLTAESTSLTGRITGLNVPEFFVLEFHNMPCRLQ